MEFRGGSFPIKVDLRIVVSRSRSVRVGLSDLLPSLVGVLGGVKGRVHFLGVT